MPAEWNAEPRQDLTWNPTVAEWGKSVSDRQPAIEASPDLDTWRNIDTDAPGVFAGLRVGAAHDAAPDEATGVHMSCVSPTTQHVKVGESTAIVQRRTDCPGDWYLTEIDLRDESGDFSVYLQIKQPDGKDWAPQILRSVTVSHPPKSS